MKPEVAELFDKLADLPPEARDLYFAEHPVDAATRQEVEELLAHEGVLAELDKASGGKTLWRVAMA